MDCTRFSRDPVIYKSTQLNYVNAADIKSMYVTAVHCWQSVTQHIKLMVGSHISYVLIIANFRFASL